MSEIHEEPEETLCHAMADILDEDDVMNRMKKADVLHANKYFNEEANFGMLRAVPTKIPNLALFSVYRGEHN